MNKVILVKRVDNNLKIIFELDSQIEANGIIKEFTEKAKFNRDFIGEYYFIAVEKIEIKRD